MRNVVLKTNWSKINWSTNIIQTKTETDVNKKQ